MAVERPGADALEHVSRLLPHPVGVAPKDWEPIRRRLGTDLPTDYKAFIDSYGGGCVDTYLWILEPGCANEFYDLIDADGSGRGPTRSCGPGARRSPPSSTGPVPGSSRGRPPTTASSSSGSSDPARIPTNGPS
ncbi:hypothetical protein GCM10023235_05630 [Kitasatospora terrestris]|uniref:Knr4/Smi1-like domain-containing protein n=1 Tax=Kitasatospora terrestris TaxID=258051 RepID=A0ABP9D7Y7_9ACTN